MSEEFDLVVVGAGSGGIAAARRASALGARVALCESEGTGGTCVLRGCVPKKLLMIASRYREELEDARAFGYTVAEPGLDWARLMAAKEAELARLSRVYEGLLDEARVQLVRGRARLVDANSVEVAGQKLVARHIVLATGSRPAVPDVPGRELGVTSNEALSFATRPEQLVIVGGGYVGVELASMYRAFGSDVTMVVREETVLRDFEGEVRMALMAAMAGRGVRFSLDAQLARVERRAGKTVCVLRSGKEHTADVVLFATGRVPNTHDLGLAQLGVLQSARGAIVVDAYSRSNVPTIHAVGDCVDRVKLTPVAIAEGRALAETLFGPVPVAVSHDHVPSAVFSQPPLAFVGLSEQKARARGIVIDCYLKSFRPLKATITGREERTTMKVIVDRVSQRVIGLHMVGSDAPEIVQGFAVAVQAGLSKAQLDQTIGIHPTAAEEFVSMRTAHCSPYDV